MAVYQDPDNPDEQDIIDIGNALDALGVAWDTDMIIGPGNLKQSDGWRGTGFDDIDEMIDYVTDGGIESITLFVWDASQGLWYVYVDY